MLGLVPKVSVLVPASVQLKLDERSPKVSPLMVRPLSKVTVRLAVRLIVLKSAVLPGPKAIKPSLQLAAVFQLPLASTTQVLLEAAEAVALASAGLALGPPGPVAGWSKIKR